MLVQSSRECTPSDLSTGISNLLQPAQAEVVLGQLSSYLASWINILVPVALYPWIFEGACVWGGGGGGLTCVYSAAKALLRKLIAKLCRFFMPASTEVQYRRWG
jgi:hypothetical protein